MRASTAQKLRLLTVTLLTGLIGSCVDSSEPSAPSTSTSRTGLEAVRQAPPNRGIDAEFTRLAKEIAGFGGMYYDRTGKLNVYVTKSPGQAMARAADVTGRLRSVGGAAVQRRLGTSAVTVREAKYDYLQLQTWKSRLTRIFKVKGVVYTDIDEEANRIAVALTPAASRTAAETVIKAANVPLDAVSFRRMQAIRQLQTVRDRIRPVPGATQITFAAPSAGPDAFFVCTVGFNARVAGQSGNFFVTASHCSDIQGGNQSTRYYQPGPVPTDPTANRIGVEFDDPEYGDPGGLCYAGFRCRLADVLLARYTAGAELGRIARTTFGLQRIGSLIINASIPRWNVIGEFSFPFLGETAHKVGRTTGWTRGPVIATCVDVEASGTGFIQLCQDIVLAGSNGGDSGAPVFERAGDGSGDVFLVGILWGGGTDASGAPVFVLSPMENIEFELGELNTLAP